MRHFTDQKGVTIIEIIATVAILAIVLTVAAYGFKDVLRRNQANAAVNDFVTTLGFARSEAVTRGRTVTVCRSTGSTSDDVPTSAPPVPSCSTAAGAGWETGYIVFVDTDGDGARDKDEALLRVVAALKSGATMTGNTSVAHFIRYQLDGFFPPGVGNGTIEVRTAEKTIKVVITKNGRYRVQ